MPKVSVITPTHNRCRLLPKAIESVRAQTFGDWELLVIDDGSVDSTAQVVGDWVGKDSRIKYIYQRNAGCAAARNRGLREAKGEYIAFLDDDDVFLPTKLEIQAQFLDEHSDYGFVYSDVDLVDQEGRYLRRTPAVPQRTFLEIIMGFEPPPTSLLIRRECFDHVGNFYTELRGTDDYDMWLRIATEFQFAYLPTQVALYVWHGHNLTRNQKKTVENLVLIYKRLLKQDLGMAERKQIVRAVMQFTYWNADRKLSDRQYKEAFFYYQMALKFSLFVGNLVHWSRFSNPVYRFIKPYLALLYCGLRALAVLK
ncbi:MAG: glycosyltransferase family 2 protein [Candidatus Omnitrophica bacterium]|nr:glycosyltransferase family 2 protein [Candidatus Omnitrophota bacterium]